ncbi:hypothetical protein EXU85_24615 [Spirosoma sp. KCTC 42546]|uniref:hypothetical protein n=1 Tax=Spirosoma sp. KCTC 42546 TaxID=2520506 RepID=UPI00115BC41F|nr:hypothetical protein [Spirosoma sp. KCTC 42546]QDK81621.1 hypothetical protein EXU85_24615 [Spirosoma sp. KCTC 42546]
MAKRKMILPPTRNELAAQEIQSNQVFALDNVTQLRQAVDQAVYGELQANMPTDTERAQTVEGLTTLGQMGLLTETDLDEARKGYL